MDALPAAIGRYEVKGFIARGGMGTLYLAWDPVLQRQVAIKLLREADNDELRTRFTREARSAANLRHRNIVTIFDIGDFNGQPFIAMEYIHGQTLGSLMGGELPPSTIRRLQFIEDLCDGLAYAHKRGVVHRDIKPANLMIDGEGTLKILDFGIARAAAESGMTQAGLLVGTLNYMSPEQVAGKPIDGRSDMFAVGTVMYELLTRRQAFPGAIDGGVLNKILNVEPEPVETLCPHLDPAIGQIVRRALQKEAAARYPDLQQMRTEVARARHALEASLVPDGEATVAVPLAPSTLQVTPTPRRGPDRDEIARRRAQQIDEHLTAARTAIRNERWDEAISRSEEALLLDQNEGRALDLAEQARLQRDEAGAREWISRAREHLANGDLTTASTCVREALTLTPESSDAIETGRLVGEARLAQERERQRMAALQQILDRAQEALERNEPASALAAADEALALVAGNAEAGKLRELAQQAVERHEREARDAAARARVGEARQLFADGHHADALAVLEQFWPAHPLVSQAWSELSSTAAQLESAQNDGATRSADSVDERTVFLPRSAAHDPGGAVAATPRTAPASIPEHSIASGPFDDSGETVWPSALAEAPTVMAPSSSAAIPAAAVSARAASPAAPLKTPVSPRTDQRPAGTSAGASVGVGAGVAAEKTKEAAKAPATSRALIYAGAAAVVILLGIAAMFMRGGSQPEGTGTSADTQVAIAPAGTGSVAPVDRDSGAVTQPRAQSTSTASPTTSSATSSGTLPTTPPAPTMSTAAPKTPASTPPPTLPSRPTASPAPAVPPATTGARNVPVPGPAASLTQPRRDGPTPPPPTPPVTTGPPRETSSPSVQPQQPVETRPGLGFGVPTPGPTVTPAPVAPARPIEVAPTAPAPAPPVAAPPPRDTPPIPSPTVDREMIVNTLNAYAAAYKRLDADAVSRLHPTIDRAKLSDNFKGVKSQSVDIAIGQVTITGNRATVATTVHTRVEPPAGRVQESSVQTEFQLQKQNNAWVIVQRRAR